MYICMYYCNVRTTLEAIDLISAFHRKEFTKQWLSSYHHAFLFNLYLFTFLLLCSFVSFCACVYRYDMVPLLFGHRPKKLQPAQCEHVCSMDWALPALSYLQVIAVLCVHVCGLGLLSYWLILKIGIHALHITNSKGKIYFFDVIRKSGFFLSSARG